MTSKTSSISLKNSKAAPQKEVQVKVQEPVVNEGFKGFFNVFKTFLLVGGDLV